MSFTHATAPSIKRSCLKTVPQVSQSKSTLSFLPLLWAVAKPRTEPPVRERRRVRFTEDTKTFDAGDGPSPPKLEDPRVKRKAAASSVAGSTKGAAAQRAVKNNTPSYGHEVVPRAPAPASRPPPVRGRTRALSFVPKPTDACELGGGDTLVHPENCAAATLPDKNYPPFYWNELAPRAPAPASRAPPVRGRARAIPSAWTSMDAEKLTVKAIPRKPEPHWIIAHLYLSTTSERLSPGPQPALLQ